MDLYGPGSTLGRWRDAVAPYLNRAWHADACVFFATLPPESCHVCATSLPYYGMRDYDTEPLVWGGDPSCAHQWGNALAVRVRGADAGATAIVGNTQKRVCPTTRQMGEFCARPGCRAWRGELGAEPLHDCLAWARGEAPEDCAAGCYVCHVRTLFGGARRPSGLWRVLRRDGVLILNLGDSYAGSWGAYGPNGARSGIEGKARVHDPARRPVTSLGQLPDGNLFGIPWRVAFALQADGWILRNDLPWEKDNCAPESVRNRHTRSHEFVFHLVKQLPYYWDADAIAEPCLSGPADVRKMVEGRERIGGKHREQTDPRLAASALSALGRKRSVGNGATRNARTVQHWPTRTLGEQHFASFPADLPKMAILAATSEAGCCPTCGKPWNRVAEKRATGPLRHDQGGRGQANSRAPLGLAPVDRSVWRERVVRETIGWRQACACAPHQAVPCVVIDPCIGSGTTAVAADELGRSWLGADHQPAYLPIVDRRLELSRRRRAGTWASTATEEAEADAT